MASVNRWYFTYSVACAVIQIRFFAFFGPNFMGLPKMVKGFSVIFDLAGLCCCHHVSAGSWPNDLVKFLPP